MRNVSSLILAVAALGSGLFSAAGQDARTVTEPVIPPSCTVLQAQQAIVSGEPASETTPDTVRIQTALTGCTTGQAVELAISGANNAFVVGPLTIPTGVTLLVDGGVTVFGSRNPADYQVTTAGVETCGTVGTAGNGCQPLILMSTTNNAIMGYGVIDGRGQDKLLINGVAASYSWWDNAGNAQLKSGGAQNNPILISLSGANAILYKITLRNSPMFHAKWSGNLTTKTGFTAWGVKVITPFSARNTDGIDPSGLNISVLNSSLSDGDDDIAVSASNAAQNITVSNVNTYSGHGISIGSGTKGGLTNMLVQNITQMGTASDSNGIGLRIKAQQSNGGLVQNVTYQNVCSANNRIAIYLSPYYSTSAGTSYPSLQNIVYRNIQVLTEGSVVLEGYQNTGATVTNISTITLDNVILDALQQSDFNPAEQNLAVTLGPGPVSPLLTTQTGTNVSYSGAVTLPGEAPYPCSVANFQYLVGELFASNAATATTNLRTESLPAPTSVTLNAMLQPAMSQITYASISGGGTYTGMPAPTAAVQFKEGSTVVGTGVLTGNGTIATATLSGVLPGTHTYTALYAGDTTFTNPLSFGSVTVTVVGVPSTTTVAVAGSLVYGAANTVSATVTGAGGTPTGMVQFFDAGVSIGTVSLTGGTATLPLTLIAGSHTLTANYFGDTTFTTSSGSASAAVVITAAPSTPGIVPTSSSINPNGTTTLAITISQPAGALAPTGMVTVLDGTTVLGTGMLSGGNVSVMVTLVTLGTHTLTIQYGGDKNYLASSSTTAISVVPPFSLSLAMSTVTLAANGAASPALTVTPAGGFSGTVTLTCSSPVPYVTCSAAPSTLTVSGTTPGVGQLILTVSPVVSEMRAPGSLLGIRSRGGPGPGSVLAALLPLGLLGLAGRRRLRWRALGRSGLLLLALSAVLAAAVTGCGNTATAKLPPMGSQVVTVTGVSGASTASAQITVTVSN